MISFQIPGRDTLTISNIVFDYNGTLALDGHLMKEAKDLLPALAGGADLYVLTADTYGTVQAECEGLPVTVLTFPRANAAACKEEIVKSRLSGQTACIGNGFNDIAMCDAADLSIAVMNDEGLCAGLLGHVDVYVPSIRAAMELFLKEGRLVATLRN